MSENHQVDQAVVEAARLDALSKNMPAMETAAKAQRVANVLEKNPPSTQLDLSNAGLAVSTGLMSAQEGQKAYDAAQETAKAENKAAETAAEQTRMRESQQLWVDCQNDGLKQANSELQFIEARLRLIEESTDLTDQSTALADIRNKLSTVGQHAHDAYGDVKETKYITDFQTRVSYAEKKLSTLESTQQQANPAQVDSATQSTEPAASDTLPPVDPNSAGAPSVEAGAVSTEKVLSPEQRQAVKDTLEAVQVQLLKNGPVGREFSDLVLDDNRNAEFLADTGELGTFVKDIFNDPSNKPDFQQKAAEIWRIAVVVYLGHDDEFFDNEDNNFQAEIDATAAKLAELWEKANGAAAAAAAVEDPTKLGNPDLSPTSTPEAKTQAEKAQAALDAFDAEFEISYIQEQLAQLPTENLASYLDVRDAVRDALLIVRIRRIDLEGDKDSQKALDNFESAVTLLRETLAEKNIKAKKEEAAPKPAPVVLPVETTTAPETGGKPSPFTAEWVAGYELITNKSPENTTGDPAKDKLRGLENFPSDVAAGMNKLRDDLIAESMQLGRFTFTVNDEIDEKADLRNHVANVARQAAGPYALSGAYDRSKLDDPDKDKDKGTSFNDFIDAAAAKIMADVAAAKPATVTGEPVVTTGEPAGEGTPVNQKKKGVMARIGAAKDRLFGKDKPSNTPPNPDNLPSPENTGDQKFFDKAKAAIENSSLWRNKKRWALRLLVATAGAVSTHLLRENASGDSAGVSRVTGLILAGTGTFWYIAGHEAAAARLADEKGYEGKAKLHRFLFKALDRVVTNMDLVAALGVGTAFESFHHHASHDQTAPVAAKPAEQPAPAAVTTEPTNPPAEPGHPPVVVHQPGNTNRNEDYGIRHPGYHSTVGEPPTVIDKGQTVTHTPGGGVDAGQPGSDTTEPVPHHTTFTYNHDSIWGDLKENADTVHGVQANADFPNQVTHHGEIASGQVVDPPKDAIRGFNMHLPKEQIDHPRGMTAVSLDGVTKVEDVQKLQGTGHLLIPSEDQQDRIVTATADALKATQPTDAQKLLLDLNGYATGNPLRAEQLTVDQKQTLLDIMNGTIK